MQENNSKYRNIFTVINDENRIKTENTYSNIIITKINITYFKCQNPSNFVKNKKITKFSKKLLTKNGNKYIILLNIRFKYLRSYYLFSYFNSI